MIICGKCKKQTKKGEPTGNLVFYRKKVYQVNSWRYIEPTDKIGFEAESQIKTCMKCAGRKMLK